MVTLHHGSKKMSTVSPRLSASARPRDIWLKNIYLKKVVNYDRFEVSFYDQMTSCPSIQAEQFYNAFAFFT
jgi:hypothetical protein